MLRKLIALTAAFGAVLLGLAATAQARTASTTHVRINHTSIRAGGSATISGSVTPNQHGHVVYLQRKAHGTWHAVAHRKLTRKSRFTFRVHPARSGTYRYRVFDPRTRTVAASHSRTLRLTVRAHRSCTAGYRPCIPPGPDVDCAGGSGNGPRYVHGPVYVTGSDPYDLDRDGDGVACESS